MKTTDSVMREKFEDKFGMCFQPFGEKLDEAKDFLSHSLAEARREEREEVINRIRGILFVDGWQPLYSEALSEVDKKALIDLLTGDNPEEANETTRV